MAEQKRSDTLPRLIAEQELAMNHSPLIVMAQGLGAHKLVAWLGVILATSDDAHAKSSARGAVFVVNVRDAERDEWLQFTATLLQRSASISKDTEGSQQDVLLLPPRFVDAEYSRQERVEAYQAGGIILVTARVLLTDLLRGELSASSGLIRAVVVMDAHINACLEYGMIGFALRLVREEHPHARICAVTDRPEKVSSGFHGAAVRAKAARASALSLWPRFHEVVQGYIANATRSGIELVEVSIRLPSKVLQIQTALVKTVQTVVRELQASTQNGVDASEFLQPGEKGVHAIVHSRFDDIIKGQLLPVWSKCSPKTRQLVCDLRTLRELIVDLPRLSCIQFWSRLCALRITEPKGSMWMVARSAQAIFTVAESRCWKVAADKQRVLVLEPNTKWDALRDTVCEIKTEIQSARNLEGPSVRKKARLEEDVSSPSNTPSSAGAEALLNNSSRVLIITRDAETVEQLSHVLRGPAEVHEWMKVELNEILNGKHVDTETNVEASESEPDPEVDINATSLNAANSTMTEWSDIEGSITVAIRPIHESLRFGFLDEFGPSFVVLYDAALPCIRQLEMFRASRPGRALRVYLLLYENCSESSRFQAALDGEVKAYERLIGEKKSLVFAEDLGADAAKHADSFGEAATGSARFVPARSGLGSDRDSRVTALQASHEGREKQVIVDVRELRSPLPAIMHARGTRLIPTTLTVGDYVLSPRVVVERKTLSDLISSLKAGRLFVQAEAMLRYYPVACLLIELGPEHAQSVGNAEGGGIGGDVVGEDAHAAEMYRAVSMNAALGKAGFGDPGNATSPMSRLVLLAQAFPKLRFIWARGPNHAAILLESIKATEKEQPDEEFAIQVGRSSGANLSDGVLSLAEDRLEESFNSDAIAFLRTIPGIEPNVIPRIAEQCESVAELFKLDIDGLASVLASRANAQKVFKFIHAEAPDFASV